jgi:hypothetical protein
MISSHLADAGRARPRWNGVVAGLEGTLAK